jgi:hypothetical protein
MYILLHVINWHATAGEASKQFLERIRQHGNSLPGVHSSHAGPTLARALNGGQVLWRLTFRSEDDCRTCLTSETWHQQFSTELSLHQVSVNQVAYYTTFGDSSAGRKRPGIWRCLVLAVKQEASREEVRQFEKELLLMPHQVRAIKNWSLGRVVSATGSRTWTHVWEQEFDDLAGLEAEYMYHPVHWGLVDRWFDPECPERIVDPHLIHAAFSIEGVVIA